MRPAQPVPGRVAGWAALATLAAVPVQWWVIAATPVGPLKAYHVPAAVLVVAVASAPMRDRVVGILRRVGPLAVAVAVWLGALAVVPLVRGQAGVEPFRQVVSLSVAGAFAIVAADRRAARLLVWAGPVAALVTIGLLLVSPVTLSPSARTLGAELRHLVVGGLVLAVWASWWAWSRSGRTGRATTGVLAASTALVAWPLLVSGARGVWVVVAVSGLLWLLRAVVAARATRSRPAVVGAGLGVASLASLAGLLLAHLATTASLEQRLTAVAEAADGIRASPLFGVSGGLAGRPPTRNLVLDSWLTGGLLAATAAAVIIAAVAWWTGRLWWDWITLPATTGWTAAAAAAGTQVVVRLLATGSGTPHLIDWLGVGLVVAALTVRAGRETDRRGAPAASR